MLVHQPPPARQASWVWASSLVLETISALQLGSRAMVQRSLGTPLMELNMKRSSGRKEVDSPALGFLFRPARPNSLRMALLLRFPGTAQPSWVGTCSPIKPSAGRKAEESNRWDPLLLEVLVLQRASREMVRSSSGSMIVMLESGKPFVGQKVPEWLGSGFFLGVPMIAKPMRSPLMARPS